MTARNISLLNATYPSVPKVDLPISGGGTATFTEITDTTATASDVASAANWLTSPSEPLSLVTDSLIAVKSFL